MSNVQSLRSEPQKPHHQLLRGVRTHVFTSRGLSVVAAVMVDLGLVWFLYFRSGWNPPAGTAEIFMVRVFVSFGLYCMLQQWTLPRMAGGETAATIDQILALSPLMVAVGIELYWVGSDATALSWRHHMVALMWSAYALIDCISTGVENQLLRERQIGVSQTP